MNNAVLISINPKWCKLIASGEKSIEVRKTRPKINAPFKCYIYCTNTKDTEHPDWLGKVIGEFTCDWCEQYMPCRTDFAELSAGSLVEPKELYEYANGKPLYGWHITDLKIYDKAKPLSDLSRWVDQGMWTRLIKLSRPPQSWMRVERRTL